MIPCSVETEEIVMAGIPEDVIGEILLRLPLEDIFRFRFVSKRWRNLIDSPNFVKSQSNLPKCVMVLLFHEKLRIYYAKLDSDYIENPSPNFKEVTLPIFSNFSGFVGHCNGLLCCASRNGSSFLVLNPFTRNHIQVPQPEPHRYSRWLSRGFGYDRGSDDYKIVALEYSYENRGYVVWIYSLKSSCWKNIVNFPYTPVHANCMFVNDALHWMVYRNGGDTPESIIALNLGNLEYFSVPLPPDYNKILFHLEVLDGCLYAIYTDYYIEHIDCYDLWVMKDYGSEESWTRLGTYNGHFRDREFLFVSDGKPLVQCDFGSFWRKFCSWTKLETRKLLVYEPSLVCP